MHLFVAANALLVCCLSTCFTLLLEFYLVVTLGFISSYSNVFLLFQLSNEVTPATGDLEILVKQYTFNALPLVVF